MKLITFAKSLAPFVGGERRLVPDQVAEDLDAEGCLSAMEDWPPRLAGDNASELTEPEPAEPEQPVDAPVALDEPQAASPAAEEVAATTTSEAAPEGTAEATAPELPRRATLQPTRRVGRGGDRRLAR